MRKSIFRNCIIFAIMACVLLFVGLFFNFDKQDETYARENPEHTSYSALINAYDNFSYDYTGEETLPSGYSLRDDYMIYTEQQSALGLCWAFGSAKTLSTTIEKATGEYVDFSEAWISAALTYGSAENDIPNYELISSSNFTNGSGGWFYGFDVVAKHYGLVLDQDFNFEDAYEVSAKDAQQYFNMYSQYATFNYIDSVKAGRFYNPEGRSDKEQITNSIKNHILNHGAVAFSMYYTSPKAVAYKSSTAYCVMPNVENDGAHLMTIIGWDDEISITYENTTYTGAWIVLNSHGNRIGSGGNEGIVYVFYDDTNIYGTLWGYKYIGEEKIAQDEVYYYDTISESNAYYQTSLKGAYYGDMVAETKETEQKNIFFQQDDISLTYAYTLSEGTQIQDITIYRGSLEVTSSFNIEDDGSSKTIKLSGSSLPTGGYKVLIDYGNDTTQNSHINQFFICDGTEINYAYFLNSGTAVSNNGYYAIYNTFNVEDREVVIATGSKSSSLSFYAVFATYNTIQSVTLNSTIITADNYSSFKQNLVGIKFNYNLDTKSEFDLIFTNNRGKSRTLKIKLIYLADETTQSWAKIHYSAGGGDNSENAHKMIVNTDNTTTLKAPTRFGYKFLGWYYSSDFSESNKLELTDNGEYILNHGKLFISDSPTVYFTSSFNSYWKRFCNAFVYAKWESTSIRTVTFETNGGTTVDAIVVEIDSLISSPTTEKEGYDFIGWFKDITLTDQWNFQSDTVQENMTLYAKFELKQLENLTLSLISGNAYVSEAFTLQLAFEHPLKEQGEISVTWSRGETTLATNSSLTYTDTVFEKGTYSYTATITFTVGNQQVQAGGALDVEVIVNLSAVVITYEEGYNFSFTDPDTSVTATYLVKVYKDFETITSFTPTEKEIDISSHVTTYGSYHIGIVKQYDDQTMAEVLSQSLEVFELSYENVDDSYKTTLLLKGTSVEESTPTNEGYIFLGWFIGEEACQFPFAIEKNTVLTADWQLTEITSAELLLDQEYPKLASAFELSVTYEHLIKGKLTATIDWYRNGTKIASTQTASLSQTLSIYGSYDYYAVVTLSDSSQETSMTTQTISFKTSVVLTAVTISYTSNGIFEINDPDNFASTYSIVVFKDSTEIASFSYYKKSIDISDYIESSGKYSISVEKSFDDQKLDSVLSEEITLAKISYDNLPDDTKYQTSFVDSGYTLAQPPTPTKLGYDFAGWTINGGEVTFPYEVTEDIQLVAHWTLKPISNLQLSADANQLVGRAFDITLSFDHELKDIATISVDWYLNSAIIETNSDLVLNQTLSTSGTFSYHTVLSLGVDGETISATSPALEIMLTYDLKKVTISYLGDFAYSITDYDEYASTYQINVYHNETNIDAFISSEETISLTNYINEKGGYKIGVIKSYQGQTLAEEFSSNIEIFEITFINSVTQNKYSSYLVEKNQLVSQPENPAMTGYTFAGWFADENFTQAFDPTSMITADATVYGRFTLNGLTIEKLTDIEFTYDAQEHEISPTLSHELEGGNFSYTWKKLEEPTFISNNKNLIVKGVKDSGTYYCEISYTINGDTANGKTNYMIVSINKASTLIDTTDIVKEYTYDGKEHTISAGANVARSDEAPEIVYENNKFKDVPNGNTLKLKVTAKKTENYLASTVVVEISIAPAKLTVKVNDATSYWLFKTDKFSYEIVSGTLYSNDSLNETYETTNNVGSNTITMTAHNSNYVVEVIDGENDVTIIPHIIISALLATSIIFLSLAIVIKTKRAKKKA